MDRKQVMAKVEEGALKEYDMVISDFLESFVKIFMKKLGASENPELVSKWTESLSKSVGEKVFKLVADEIQKAAKRQ